MAFKPYYDLTNQGYTYTYYAPEPPPTPVVEATLKFADGRPSRVIRLPGAVLGLASSISGNWRWRTGCTPTSMRPARSPATAGRVAGRASYARHLCATYPGCKEVALQTRMHKIPELPRVLEILESSRGAASTSTPRSFTARPNGSETSRATD